MRIRKDSEREKELDDLDKEEKLEIESSDIIQSFRNFSKIRRKNG